MGDPIRDLIVQSMLTDKAAFEAYLSRVHNADIKPRRNFNCIYHPDSDPSMSLFRGSNGNYRIYCHGCHWGGNFADVIAKDHGLPPIKTGTKQENYHTYNVALAEYGHSEYLEQEEAKAGEGLSPEQEAEAREKAAARLAELKARAEQLKAARAVKEQEAADRRRAYLDRITSHDSHPAALEYFRSRGISDEAVRQLRTGYDPDVSIPIEQDGGGVSFAHVGCVVIETMGDCYIHRIIDVPPGAKGQRYRTHGGGRPINVDELFRPDDTRPVYLVEGAIDCLSMLTMGRRCVALGSPSYVDFLLNLIDEKAAAGQTIGAPLVAALDDDDTGKASNRSLVESLKKRKLCGIDGTGKLYPGGVKDANDALTQQKAAFEKNLRSFDEYAAKCYDWYLHPGKADYLRKCHVAERLPIFWETCNDDRDDNWLTGFKEIDDEEAGIEGLFPGLYVLGAMPSVGKTAFCLQLADQVAASGKDVLYVSLEMSANELLARSIARYTARILANPAQRGKFTAQDRWKYRQVLRRGKKGKYGPGKEALLSLASGNYEAEVQQHMFIAEAARELRVSDITHLVETHVRELNSRPLVIVDYLQMIGGEPALSDKQNMDNTTRSLKLLSVKYDIPVLVISSLNRANYIEDKKNQTVERWVSMAAFKESGSIEYSADVLLALHRIEKTDSPTTDNEEKLGIKTVEIQVLKNRSGKARIAFPFVFTGAFQMFEFATDVAEQGTGPEQLTAAQKKTRNYKRKATA